MKKRLLLFLAGMLLAAVYASAQEAVIAPPENLIVDGVPQIPASLAETAGRYGSFRSANLADWHPAKREMLIATRFAETPQLHLVKMPEGARQQLTFFADSVGAGRFHPNGGDYIVFAKDIGGGEWYQLYRYDMKAGNVTLLTDGKSRNLPGPWSSDGDRIAYMSTRRTRKDTDLWVMNPGDPQTDHLLTQLAGGGWQPEDWSPDDKKILLKEEISINESYLWLVDTTTGEKIELTPRNAAEKVSYGEARFSKDGKGIYVTTDRDSEFRRLAYLDLATKQPSYLTKSIHWDVETFDLTHDGKMLAFVTNEEGMSVLHVRDTATGKEMPLPVLPAGVMGGVRWHKNGHELGFSLNNARGPGDCYSLDVATGKFERWTTSETAVKTESFPQAELVRWKSFDGKMISGFLYKPPAKFTGKRPVLVEIHGGPEGQSQPRFLGRSNYFLNELGIVLIYPNVRGSTGYGKTFSLLDNGFKREDTYKDINALFDWIATRSDLDSAYGVPAGETPEHLIVYRKNNVEYHVGFVPDPTGRAALIVELPPQGAQSFALDQAMAEARKLLPKDAQPPNPPPNWPDHRLRAPEAQNGPYWAVGRDHATVPARWWMIGSCRWRRGGTPTRSRPATCAGGTGRAGPAAPG